MSSSYLALYALIDVRPESCSMIEVKGEAYVLCLTLLPPLCWSQEEVFEETCLILGQTTSVRSDQIRHRVRFLWAKGDMRLFSSQLTSASWQHLNWPQILDAATQLF